MAVGDRLLLGGGWWGLAGFDGLWLPFHTSDVGHAVSGYRTDSVMGQLGGQPRRPYSPTWKFTSFAASAKALVSAVCMTTSPTSAATLPEFASGLRPSLSKSTACQGGEAEWSGRTRFQTWISVRSLNGFVRNLRQPETKTEHLKHSTPCTPCAYFVDFHGHRWTLTDRLHPSKYGVHRLN